MWNKDNISVIFTKTGTVPQSTDIVKTQTSESSNFLFLISYRGTQAEPLKPVLPISQCNHQWHKLMFQQHSSRPIPKVPPKTLALSKQPRYYVPLGPKQKHRSTLQSTPFEPLEDRYISHPRHLAPYDVNPDRI